MAALDLSTFAALVDHTLLKASATAEQIDTLCDEALTVGTAAVCVNGMWVGRIARRLGTSGVRACSVVGFPLGAMSVAAIGHEARAAVDDGATEIDMVIPVGPLIAGDRDGVVAQIEAVRRAVGDAVLKVILETAILTDDQIRLGCQLAEHAGADFVKTSTGFDPAGGASVGAVSLMRATVGDRLGVKASGGIRSLADVTTMVDAGASRLGMSATLAVADQLRADHTD